MKTNGRGLQRAAIIAWIFPGLVVLLYGLFGVLGGSKIYGVEQLADYAASATGVWIFAAAFASILIEGTYVVGMLLPGSTIVVLSAFTALINSATTFIFTIIFIFVGWTLACVINYLWVRFVLRKQNDDQKQQTQQFSARWFLIWFPAYRANDEVERFLKGDSFREVFIHSTNIKFWTSLVMLVVILLLSLVLDMNPLSNEEGFGYLIIFGLISIYIGIKSSTNNSTDQGL